MFPLPRILNNNINPNVHTEYDRFYEYVMLRVSNGTYNNATASPAIATGSLAMNKWTAYTAGTVTGIMVGSSWSTNQTRTDSSVSRATQHMYPSLAVYQQSFTRGDVLLVFRNGTGSTSRFQAVNRNGYASLANNSGGNCAGFNSMIFYDPTLFRVRQFNGNRVTPTYTDFIF